MNFWAIIPARGGSKRLPRKNVALLHGKPLISYTIEAAKTSKKLSGSIVSTDDDEIADVARSSGAEVPFRRPADLANDKSSVIDVINHAVNHLEQNHHRIEAIVLLQPTSPLRCTEHIDEAIELYKSSEADTITSVRESSEHPYWSWMLKDDLFQPYFSMNHMSIARHDLPPAYVENGAIFIVKRSIITSGKIYGSKIVPFIMDRESSIDVDSIDDLMAAEAVLKKRSHSHNSEI